MALHHVLAGLYKLSCESLQVASLARVQPSFFGVAQLMNIALANITARMMVFWPGLMSHLGEVCQHESSPMVREWGAVVVCRLVTEAVVNVDGKSKTDADLDRMRTAVTALWALRHVEHEDVRAKLIDCVTRFVHEHSVPPPLWTTLIDVLAAVVVDCAQRQFTAALVKQSYNTLTLLVTDFIGQLPIESLRQLVEVDAKFGSQTIDLNISLSAVGQLVSTFS